MITKQEIITDMSEVAIEGIQELTDKTVRKLKYTGLMAPELCLVALNILEMYSENAKGVISGMKNLEATIIKADKLLKELGLNP